MKDDLIYLKHILESIEQIENYLYDVDYEVFIENDMIVNATVRMLEVIGEATNNFSKSFQDSHVEIDFRDIVDMRNFLIHEYFGVNKKIVWDTCKTDLPELKESVLRILK
ncbi:DUF86 domain-containing protein [Candidatus Parcubacteria bacterium]|nr:DUF86 domain-containing protein [Candidatus Parcubacteria bacterium]